MWLFRNPKPGTQAADQPLLNAELYWYMGRNNFMQDGKSYVGAVVVNKETVSVMTLP